eukprot:UN02265
MAIFDEQAAIAGVKKIYADLQALQTQCKAALEDGDNLTATTFTSLCDQYHSFPTTWDVAWERTDIKRDDAVKLANEVRGYLQDMTGRLGVNKAILPLFNQQ